MRTPMRFAGCLLALALVLPAGAQAARHDSRPKNPPRANQGHIPPAPSRRAPAAAAPSSERMEGGRVNSMPHVNHDQWFGHDRADDPRYHIAQPFTRGHFAKVGPSFRYEVVRVDRNLHRLWIPGGSMFDIAAWDWSLCSDWCWDCGDDFVVYADTDHPGWYLIYNIHTGVYVHATFAGP